MSRESATATKSFVADNGRIHLQQQPQQQPQLQQQPRQQSHQRSATKSLKTFSSLDETSLNIKNKSSKTEKSESKFDFSSSDDDDYDHIVDGGGGGHPKRLLNRQHHSLTEDFVPNKLKQYHHRHPNHHQHHQHNHPHFHHSNQSRYFRGNFYQVNPICVPTTTTTTTTSSSESMLPTVPSLSKTTLSSSLTPREPSTSSSASSSSSSSSTTTSPSEASFDLELAFQQQQQQLQQQQELDSGSLESSSSSTYVTSRPNKLLVATSIGGRKQKQSSKRSSSLQQPPISSTFWDLITDVAKDLDLKLQDLSPDSEIFEQPKSATITTTNTTSATAESSSTKSKKNLKQLQTSSSPSPSPSPSSSSNQNNNVIGNIDQHTKSCHQRLTKRQQINDGTSPYPSSTPPAPPPRGITKSSCIIISNGGKQDKENNKIITTTITATNQTDSYKNQSSSSFNNDINENERIFDDIINVVSKWNQQQRQSQQQQQSIINGNEQQMSNVDSIFNIDGQHSSSIITTSNGSTIAPIEPPPPSPPSPFANRGKRSSPCVEQHQTISGGGGCCCITVEPPEQFAQCNNGQEQQQPRTRNIDVQYQYNKNMQKQSSTSSTTTAAFITDRKTLSSSSSKFIGEQFGQQQQHEQQQYNESTRINDFNQKLQQPRYTNNGRESRKSQQNSFIDTTIQLFESTSSASIPLQRQQQNLKDQTNRSDTIINGNVCDGLEMINNKSIITKTIIDNRTATNNNINQSPRNKTRPMSNCTNSATNAMSKNKQIQQKPNQQQKVEVKPRFRLRTGRNMKQEDNEGLGQIILGNKPPPPSSSSPQSNSLTNKLYNDHHHHHHHNDNNDGNGNGNGSVSVSFDKSSGRLDSTQLKSLEEVDVGRLKLLNFEANNCVDGDGEEEDDDVDDLRSSASEHLSRHPICPKQNDDGFLRTLNIFSTNRIAAISAGDPPTFSTFTTILTPLANANANNHPSSQILNNNIQCQSSLSSSSFLHNNNSNNSNSNNIINCFKPIKMTNTPTTITTVTDRTSSSSFISNTNRNMTNHNHNHNHNFSSSAFKLVSPKDKTETVATTTSSSSSVVTAARPQQHKTARLLNIEILRTEDNEIEENDEDGEDDQDDEQEDGDKDLPEGNVDDDDDGDGEDADELNEEEEEEMEEEEDDAAAPYEVDADDEQSNDMLDDGTEEDDEYEDHGPNSTSPAPILLPISSQQPPSMVTKIDLPKSMMQIISMKVNNHNNDKTAKDPKMATVESEDSAADVSYERTSDNESDVDDEEEEEEDEEETTITTVNTNNVNNVDLKELNFDQRFKMTQTIWYLPHINRATVVHYLQGKSVGVFIVRQSSKPNTMAISVRLPQGRGPHVEHYLIEKIIKPPLGTKAASAVFRLEGSEHYFNTIVQLVIHYSNCQDELPVQLSLPSVLLTSTRSQLSSLGLLGQEFWQSKFVSLKQLPKNSLNNETLAMINQNCDEMRSQPPLPMINHLVHHHHHQHHQRQPAKRHNSNSSESNASKSSISCSPMPNVRSRRNTSDSASPTTVPKMSPPPPLPPKCDLINSPLIGLKQKPSPNIGEDNLQSQPSISSPVPMVMIENATPTTTMNVMPKLPPRGNNQSYVPPPVPPRNPRNSPGSTPPPPLPSNGPPISSLRSKKPPITAKGSANVQDLLSPMSMTESEIEMAKFQMSHSKHLAPNILEVEEYDENEDYDQEMGMIDAKSKARLNYYNHMVQAQSSSSPLMPGAAAAVATTTQSLNELLASQTSPPPSLPNTSSFLIPAASPQPLLSLQDHSGSNAIGGGGGSKCDVCTQTYETKASLFANKTSLQANNNGARITRANSSLSCFYMDPIDALVAIHAAHQQPKRHSDPELASSSINTTTNDMDSSTLNQTTFSLSHSLESLLENFRNRFSSAVSSNEFNSIRETILNERLNRQQLLKNIDPVDACKPMGQAGSSSRPDAAFSTIDSAWQWHSGNHHHHPHHHLPYPLAAARLKVPGNNNNGAVADHLLKRSSITTNGSMKSDITTVEDLISANVPELAVPKITHIDQQHKLLSGLDNDIVHSRDRKLTSKSIGTDVGTEFSEPWNLDLVESMFLSELNVGGSQGGSGSMIHPDEDADTTRQLLNNDLINFNSFLLNQEHPPNPTSYHHQQQQQPCEDDYDNVADDEEINSQFLKRDDSEITLKDGSIVVVPRNPISHHHHPSTPATNDNGIKLNIAYNISNYVFELASRKDNTFAKSIDNFIECTKETTDPNPSLILGYVRQFMNGMKNYLLKNGEGDFGKIVQNERSRLKPNQFLNIDSILEVSLQKLIIKPLKNFIYELFIRSHTQSGSLKILSTNIKLAQNKTPEELGIRTELLPIEPRIMAEIQKNLRRLQQSYSPIKKMEHLLRCVAILNGNYREKMSKCQIANANVNANGGQASKYNRAFSGDDLLPMLVYLIVHCGVISADIESEYMLGLLHPSILNGEGSYYLTILSSAIQVLKTMYAVDSSRQLEDIIQLNNGNNNNNNNRQQSLFSIIRSQPSENLQRQMSSTSNGNVLMGSTPPLALPSIANLQAYMKIMIPNELTSNITCKTVPVRHNMTTKEVCRMIAHTFRITNPEDYALYRIKENGLEEIQLLDNEYPQVIKSELMARGETPMFAYKRCDAKFIWPITSPN